jgi:hypothetical protein
MTLSKKNEACTGVENYMVWSCDLNIITEKNSLLYFTGPVDIHLDDPTGKFCLKKSSVDFSNKINILLNNAVHGYEIKPFSIWGARHRLSAGCVNPCTYGICPAAAAAATAAE